MQNYFEMKKKTFLFVGLCVFLLTICETRAFNLQNSTQFIGKDLPHGYEELELYGNLMFGIGPNAINAGVGEDAVYIQFNQSFGYVAISLYNESGVLIYNDVVDTGVQQSVVIPINNVSSGSYLLELNNAAGYAEGFFDR